MKIQHLAIVFVIIILPISMVISYYTGSQIKTIKMQQSYDSKLLTATYDSIRSFQLNTLNNKYSSLSDSKIRDIEASISTFYDSLGSELGSSGYKESTLSDYIPAILFGMYDGYYIYGKYYNEALPIKQYNEDGTEMINQATGENVYKYGGYQYGLKPYVYYSCRYKKNANTDFTVNYTLDNTITVYGKVNSEYVTKTGALINPSLVDISNYPNSIKYDGITIKPEILKERVIILIPSETITDVSGNIIFMDEYGYYIEDVPGNKNYITDVNIIAYLQGKLADKGKIPVNEPNGYEYVKYNNRKVYMDKSGYFWINKNKKQYITDEDTLNFARSRTSPDGHLYSNSAVEYFYNAYQFSLWVNSHLNGITQDMAVDFNGNKIEFSSKTTGNIFELNSNNNPLLEKSIFNENRMAVIRQSIETNLSATISNFGSGVDFDFAMPKFSEEDWYKITNNISVASFMQGIPIGSKIFNDYCVITNDKNKEFVSQESIYMIARYNDNNVEVHYPGCKDIQDNKILSVQGYSNVDFERQTAVSSDDDNNYYYYPHEETRSYNCMVNITSTYDLDDIKAGNNLDKYTKVREAYLTALAREKYDLYRTNNYFGI